VITALCWYWVQPEGRTRYEPLHVAIWADMVRRHLSVPHRLAVVTNEALSLPGVDIIRPPADFENVRIPSWPEHRPQCLRRLSMFRPDAAEIFGDEILCFDLDCVVGGSLDPLVCPGGFRMAVGTSPARPYNGSLLYLAAGARPQVFERFTAAGAAEAGRKFVGSDQAWIAHCLGPNEATWGEADGLVYHGMARSPETVRRVMFFPGSEKPWMRPRDPWVNEHYRRSPRGRCLVLGYDSTLWSDVERALDSGPYDAVISSPEAAEHWPGEILAIAPDNPDAARLAHMHGFDDVTWCGVKERRAA
jgi:hypothetical protein